MDAHSGHRSRRRERFFEYGGQGFDDEGLLELLLFYALPRIDVNPVVRALLERFGSLEGVLKASRAELTSVPGVGDSTAMLIKLLPAIAGRCGGAIEVRRLTLVSPTEAGRFLLGWVYGETEERAYLVSLDAEGRVLECRDAGRGGQGTVDVSVRRLLDYAKGPDTAAVILAHNHPSGIAVPSAEDARSTRLIVRALHGEGVKLIDHIVLAGDDFVSMADNGEFPTVMGKYAVFAD